MSSLSCDHNRHQCTKNCHDSMLCTNHMTLLSDSRSFSRLFSIRLHASSPILQVEHTILIHSLQEITNEASLYSQYIAAKRRLFQVKGNLTWFGIKNTSMGVNRRQNVAWEYMLWESYCIWKHITLPYMGPPFPAMSANSCSLNVVTL